MHPVRRRKKRPNYGVRTVEVSRGKNGFGFTISGQQPCILSCIVPESPAESAGLRAGDYLVAVEGQSVSKVPHEDVVSLIASSSGILKLQIAENYYSDSSDDDAIVTARQKPKYPHKLRNNVQNSRSNGVTQQSRAAKVVRDLRSGVMFEEQVILEPALHVTAVRNTKSSIPESPQWKARNHLPPPLPRLYFPGPSRACSQPPEIEEQLLQAVVGYLGTIEMPRKIPPGSRLQIVRGCIKRLRADKRTHTVVLMTVLRQSLRLTNSAGQVLAIYPADRVTFCGSSSDEDRKHFGIVTTSTGEDPSNSCHVFTIDSRNHPEHIQKMQVFKIECNIDPVTGHCREFPQNSDGIIAVVRNFYESGVIGNRVNDLDEPVMANSPQPSNDSTTTTSNSDSGIGFRDDCGNQSDRILVVDVQNQCLHIQQIRSGEERQETISDCERLAVRAMPVPCDPQHIPTSSAAAVATSNRSRSPLSSSSEGGNEPREDMSVSSSGAAKSPSAGNGRHSADDMSVDSARSQDAVYNKLSPKVFGVPPPPTSQSLEDLKVSEQTSDAVSTNHLSRNQQHWGSLQELRSFVSDCFETSPATQELHEDTDEGVSCWATSFEKLLEDSNGLRAFAEFLKKEFSHENIYFWVACERYRNVEDVDERRRLAQVIFDKHLCLGALEPVNVDSHARQVTQEELGSAHPTLFLQAQKQIFNLMKFDSYPRFIKSDLYNKCLLKEISGEKLPFEGKMDSALELNVNTSHNNNNCGSSSSNGGSRSNSSNQSPHQLPHSCTKLKKSRSDAEERLRRKSLLPWSRKSRCKSRDRVAEDAESSVSSSRSSLASWDLTLSSTLCRVILPDGATAVVQIRPPQTIRQLIQRLLEKRALCYSHFQVFFSHLQEALALEEDATVLGGQEVRVEYRVVFKLDLPNRKTVAVKSKHNKTLAQVLRPILNRYGYRLEMVTLCLMSENEVVEPSVSVTAVDDQRIQVLTRSTPTECMAHMQGWHVGDYSATTHNKKKLLDEITNRVFEDLLQGKTENLRPTASDQGSVRSDDWGSEHSSGIVSRFLRSDSAFLDKGRDCRHKSKKANKQLGSNEETKSINNNVVSGGGGERKPSKLPPLIAKWKPGTKLEGRSESDVLYEDLKRAQRSRLEDQRGTEINFELPDFLKDKENAPQSVKKIRKIKGNGIDIIGNSTFYQQDTLQSSGDDKSSLTLHNETSTSTSIMSRYLEQSFPTDGSILTQEQAEEYFLSHSRMPPPKCNINNNNTSTSNNNNNVNISNGNDIDSTKGTTLARSQKLPSDPPPPLPPKPKLPPPPSSSSSSSSWPLSCSEDPKLRNCRVRRAVYLDQPSSSFV